MRSSDQVPVPNIFSFSTKNPVSHFPRTWDEEPTVLPPFCSSVYIESPDFVCPPELLLRVRLTSLEDRTLPTRVDY